MSDLVHNELACGCGCSSVEDEQLPPVPEFEKKSICINTC
jgi:hypothetical protein